MNPQAIELNSLLEKSNIAILDMLSLKGKSIFFPKQGILAQSKEAQGKKINATIGIAVEDDNSPMRLKSIEKNISLAPGTVFPYAPSFGRDDLRTKWKEMIFKKNPSLVAPLISNPVVTNGLTHALSIAGYLFVDEGDQVIMPDLFWGNYKLVYENAYGGKITTFPCFENNGFNVAGLEEKLNSEGTKKILVLNFPNNPSGFTPSDEEVERIVAAIKKSADLGKNIVVIIDDAYFGLVYEKGIYTESLFSKLCDIGENVLAVKIDGATKEDYVWGLRVGFMTYGCKDMTPEICNVLESKTGGAVRGNVSNACNLSQTLIVEAMKSDSYWLEKKEKYGLLKSRYDGVVKILEEHTEYRQYFEALPFNSGYFMCVKLKNNLDANKVRKLLLDEYSTGLISIGDLLRVSYSSVKKELLPELFDNVYTVCKRMVEGENNITEDIGIKTKGKIYHNVDADVLVKKAVERKEGILSKSGVLRVLSGKYTGRVPNDRYIVDTPSVHDKIHWGDINVPIDVEDFDKMYEKITKYLGEKEEVFVCDGVAGADKKHSMNVRVINELASQNLSMIHLLRRPTKEELKTYKPEFTLICAPHCEADSSVHNINSEAFILINLEKKIAIIGGTRYIGEIKKVVFSVMNYFLPLKGILPLHCSANTDKEGNVALFLGLSGTGKTSLSTDVTRKLIGDDEHGWSPAGVFNIEGGCYAKCIDLCPIKEPQIHKAIKNAAVVENVVLDDALEFDFSDDRHTENSRVAYPIEHLDNSEVDGIGGHPKTIIFLTADASGVLPPIAKLDKNQAMYHFISGYTSKLAGTEQGIVRPVAVFSMFFGEPFMPHKPNVYTSLLEKYITDHNTDVYLVNTGWVGGPYGVGKRISIPYSRAMVNAAIKGDLKDVEFVLDEIFNLMVPKSCPGVEDAVLNPKSLWEDKELYEKKAKELAALFSKNISKFEDIPEKVKKSGPVHRTEDK
ncbi:MAG: phosphoenolpyruvate carboxykinase (ATP) [Candidatus Aenigmarchaeota archaeon]|nr:phosphoenolpyruvate carboxykinase (ATP) [Candidatus Aenigmarchaeota archaeon]